MLSENKSEDFLCITPTLEIVSKEETLSKALQSHKWQVVKAEAYGTDGFLTKIVCTACGLERTAIVSNVEDSAKRAFDNRKIVHSK
jgi:hypothetical protein